MGTIYYGICHDCKQYVNLDKFYSWRSYQDADHSSIDNTNLEEFKTNGWISKALRLHIFLHAHNGHRIGVYTEHDCLHEDMQEQFPWPDSLKRLTEYIDMSPLVDRVMIKTSLGDIYIDDRGEDINAFRFINGIRVDTSLLIKNTG